MRTKGTNTNPLEPVRAYLHVNDLVKLDLLAEKKSLSSDKPVTVNSLIREAVSNYLENA